MNQIINTARRIAIAAAVTLTSASAFATNITVNAVDNGGFESPTQSAGAFTYLQGVVNGWTYTGGGVGVAANNSAFNVVNAIGGQAAFLQQPGSSISQAFNFTQNILSVSFVAEARGYAQGANPISVMIDGMALIFSGTTVITPGSTTSFVKYTSNVIGLTSGMHTLSFVGTGTATSGDRTTFIDGVVLTTAVPEPVTLGLFGLGLVALGATRRKARKQA